MLSQPHIPSANVTFEDNQIQLTNNTGYIVGIQLGSCDTCGSGNIRNTNITAKGNTITGDGTNGTVGIELRGVNDATLEGNTLNTLQEQAISACCGNSGTAKIIGNMTGNLSLLTTANL